MQSLLLYLQQFIFFKTYKLAQSATVLHYTRLEGLERNKLCNLLDTFISDEENKVL